MHAAAIIIIFVLDLIDLACANRTVLVLAVFVSALSSLIFLASMVYPNLTSILQSSTNTPWGVVTSIFLHADILHLYGNLVFLWLWTGYIILPDSLLNKEQTKQRLRFFAPTVFGAAVITNVAWLVIAPQSNSFGASGLVFAVAGMALGLSLMNLVNIVSRFRSLSQEFRRKRLSFALVSNASSVILFLILIVFYKNYFLAIELGVNVFAHGVAFLLAFFYIMGREYAPSMRTIIRDLKYSRKTKS